MIIRKKTTSEKKQPSSKQAPKGNVIKKEDLLLNAKNIPKEDENKTIQQEKNEAKDLETFEKIDISSIEFKERVERRRGDRRRGYRRIDERSLVSRAQQEAHSIKELAAREGYKNGLEMAQEEIAQIKNALVEFLSMKDEMYEEFYPHIMEIALDSARKIINQEVTMSNEILKNTIMSVMDEINPDTQRIEIKVNSKDLEFAKASLPEIIQEKNITAKVTVSDDDTVDMGSCIVIANNGVIDANFKTQLSVLQSAFGIYKGGV